VHQAIWRRMALLIRRAFVSSEAKKAVTQVARSGWWKRFSSSASLGRPRPIKNLQTRFRRGMSTKPKAKIIEESDLERKTLRWNIMIGSTFAMGVGLFYTSISYSNIKYDIEPMRGVPYDSALASYPKEENKELSSSSSSTGEEEAWEKYMVMRIFTKKKKSATQAPLSLSSFAVGWVFGAAKWSQWLTGFNNATRPHVLKEGETVGNFVVLHKSQESIVFAKTGNDIDVFIGLDLVQASVSHDRDKYYACFGVKALPKTTYGQWYMSLILPLHMMAYNVMLKYGARYAQDLYAGTSGSIHYDALRDAVAQKEGIKQFKKRKKEDMGYAEP